MRNSLLLLCLVLFTGLAKADSLFVRQVGKYPLDGGLYYVAVEHNYAYVTAALESAGVSLRVLSLADPTRPVEVGSLILGRGAWSVTVVGEFAYVCGHVDSMLYVVSVADPANPVVVGKCRAPSSVSYVAVRGQYAYLPVQSGFCVVSVADPANPVQVGWMEGGFDNSNLDLVGDYAYVSDYRNGLHIMSIADPTQPTQVGFFASRPDDVAVSDGLAYFGGEDSSFRIVSVSDPTHPVEVSRIHPATWANLALGVELLRGYAFVATEALWWSGLYIVSVRDPRNPVLVASYDCGYPDNAALGGGYIYVASQDGIYILQFYQLGDLDIDPDSLDVVHDTLRLRRWTEAAGLGHDPESQGRFRSCPAPLECAYGEFVLGNTSATYNPDTVDGPSQSPVDSISFVGGSLAGPGGSIDSITIANLPRSRAPGQTVVCSLSAYIPVGLRDGDYTGTIIISGKDTARLLVEESCYVMVKKLGDIDVDNDSLDVVADTVRVRPRLVSSGPPPEYTNYAYGQFIFVNTTQSFNPDTTDGPSRSAVHSLRCSGVLSGPHGTIDSILIPNLPESLSIGQAVVCTLAVYVPAGLPQGDYSGPIVISSDSLQPQIAETLYALVTKLGDPDIDDDSLNVVHDTMNLRTQPAGPVYHPYAKAEFMLVNASSSYNPDTSDGPSRSPLQGLKVEAKVEAQDSSLATISVLNLPSELEVGQAVECTLALTLPVHVPVTGFGGWAVISALDTAGYEVLDSFFLRVRGPQPRENLDSLRVAPIPFKPNQNPEHDAIHFQGLSAGARVTVYDASGQSVWSATESGDGHLAWDARVASGIYVYLVVSADGKASKVGKLSVIR
jgi:hypothetical protein